MDELLAPPSLEPPSDTPSNAERRAVKAMTKVTLMVIARRSRPFGEKLTDEQESADGGADMAMDVYGSESALRRAEQASETTPAPACTRPRRVFVNDAGRAGGVSAKTALAGMADGDGYGR